MRVSLLTPGDGLPKLGTYLRHSALEPLGLEYLSGIAKAKGHDVRIHDSANISSDQLVAEVIKFRPNVLGFSAMSFNFSLAHAFARRIKEHIPAAKTVFGGYHPSARPEIVRHEDIDFAVMGEGEKTFVELLDALNFGIDVARVGGIAYWRRGLQINCPRERIGDLDELPFPSRSLDTLEGCKVGGLSYPPPNEQRCVCQISYSRGCAYGCLFCNSAGLWRRQVVWRSARNVVDEIEYLQWKFRTNMLFFTDLTFDLNVAKAYELCREIKRRRIQVNWFAMCRPDHFDRNLMFEMREAGCTKISYGVDALDSRTLSLIKQGQNVSYSKIKCCLEVAGDVGFIVKAYVIIGYPWETKESVRTTGRMLKGLAIDELRISFLTPFPGTPIHEQFKCNGLLITEDFERYTSDEPIIKVKDLTSEELLQERERIFRQFYGSTEYMIRAETKIRKFPHLKESYDEFYEFLHASRVLS